MNKKSYLVAALALVLSFGISAYGYTSVYPKIKLNSVITAEIERQDVLARDFTLSDWEITKSEKTGSYIVSVTSSKKVYTKYSTKYATRLLAIVSSDYSRAVVSPYDIGMKTLRASGAF